MKTILFLLLAFFSIDCIESTSKTTKITKNEILWDTWGVPHIYAKSEINLYYSFGWAQMHSHADLLMKLYGQARGKAAEYWGVTFFDTDSLVNMLSLPQIAQLRINNMSDKEMSVIQAFTDGINAYAKENIELISKKLRVVLPLKPCDIIAHAYRVFYLEFLSGGNLSQVKNWAAGSNAWAVSPKKSESGNSLLLGNPHLPWSDLWMFYEAHLNLENLNLYGATLVGMPFIGIGFNEYLGWTHTVNTIDNVDLYEITIKNDQYLLDGQYHNVNKQTRILKIKQDSGYYRIDTLIIKTTPHGIILKERGNKAVAIRFARMENPPDLLNQWYEMGKSTSFKTFENALKLNELPLFNILYADKAGNILYHFGGHVPKKPFGDWNTWNGIVSGKESKNIWNTYHSYEELPKILNPVNGWLQNANDPPWTSTFPELLHPEDYPPYLAPVFMHFRAQQSAILLSKDEKISFNEFIEYKHSTLILLADRILDDLLPLKAQIRDSLTLDAFKILASWDKSMNANSKGAILFINWIKILAGNNMNDVFEIPWSFDKPATTPDGIKDKKKAISALSAAARSLKETNGTLETEYGSLYRLRIGKFDFPANGGDGSLGLFRTLYFRQDNDNKYRALSGDSFVMAVEFGKEIRANVLLSYGNATQSANKHIGDQLSLFSEKKLRDALIIRSEVEKNLESKELIKTH